MSFESIKELAQTKAIAAIHAGNPVVAREWTEVAAVAEAASRGRYPPQFLEQTEES